MTTVATSPLPRPVGTGRYDRVFYSSIAIVLALTAFVGFGPTYYFDLLGSSPLETLTGGPVTPLVHLHAALFTGWVLLFIAQTALVARRKVAIHRRLGIAGAVLAASMVTIGIVTALNGAARGAAPAGVDPMSFLLIPLSDMVLFGCFVAAAVLLRANREAHKRLMLLAYVCVIVAAVARLPGVLPLGPLAFFGLAFLFVLAGAVFDRVTRQRVHPAYVWGGSFLVLSVPVRLTIAGTETWMGFARWLVGLV